MKNEIIRKCQSCKQDKNRDKMWKITRFEGEIYLNPETKIVGRSVYVCKNEECVKKFIKMKAIKKMLKFNRDEKIREIETEMTTKEKT